jgi:hypothetical protein
MLQGLIPEQKKILPEQKIHGCVQPKAERWDKSRERQARQQAGCFRDPAGTALRSSHGGDEGERVLVIERRGRSARLEGCRDLAKGQWSRDLAAYGG